jgi:hypothetical protein
VDKGSWHWEAIDLDLAFLPKCARRFHFISLHLSILLSPVTYSSYPWPA